MFGLPILDIAIGLIFIYLVMSLICTAIREAISNALNERASDLEEALRNLLKSPGIGSPQVASPDTGDTFARVYNHPLVRGLYERNFKGEHKPSYIPAKTFALALLDVVAPEAGGSPDALDQIRAQIEDCQNETIKRTLLPLLNHAQGDLVLFRKNIEEWFNGSMDRLSAWYKRKSQWWILGIAAIVAIAGNVDTIQITKALSHDNALRQALVAQAQQYVKENPNEPKKMPANQIRHQIDDIEGLGIPIGWPTGKTQCLAADEWFPKILGLLLSTFALSLGAPFWFDMLKKVITIRSAGEDPQEKAQKILNATVT